MKTLPTVTLSLLSFIYFVAVASGCCDSHCTLCDATQNVCYSCASGYYLLNHWNCVEDCPIGTFKTNTTGPGLGIESQQIDICEKCLDHCNVCHDTVMCDECDPLYPLGDHYHCSNYCGEGAFLNYTISGCQACGLNCRVCQNDTVCEACSWYGDWFLYNNECFLGDCPPRTYPTTLYNDRTCHDCMDNCDTCIGPNTCLSCSDSTPIYYNQACISSCPSGTFQLGRTCVECMHHCRECRNATSCDLCSESHPIYEYHRCNTACPNGTFSQGENCIQCIANCEECGDTLSCVKCAESHPFFHNSNCMASCPSGTSPLEHSCTASYWLNTFDLSYFSDQWPEVNGYATNLLPINNPDANNEPFWNAANANGYYLPAYVAFDLRAPFQVSKFEYKSLGDTVHDPLAFDLQVSDSKTGVYTTVGIFEGADGPDMKVFTLEVPVTARFWKFTISSTYSGYQACVSYVNFFVQ